MVLSLEFVRSADVERIKKRLDHPVIDSDGHQIEFMPLVNDILREVADKSVAERANRLAEQATKRIGVGRISMPGFPPTRAFFGFPTRNTLDRLTATLPELLYRRLDELGIDFAIVYPSHGLNLSWIADDEVRQAKARALNTYYAEVFDGYRDRLEPVATIPTNTPHEAVAELQHAVGVLGLKAVVMGAVIPRQQSHDGTIITTIDTLGHASLYDYDPVWAACERLGVAPAFHGFGYGWNTRCSSTNYVYNHLGSFAVAQEAACRSLFMGGIPMRFPNVRFAFLEGGVAWAAQLSADMVGHFEKRNRQSVRNYDPAEIDISLSRDLLSLFAHGRMAERTSRFEQELSEAASTLTQDDAIDDFAESGIQCTEDIGAVFSRQFYFGCEADDPLNVLAFNKDHEPQPIRLNAMFSSDIGHWDVPDMRQVLCDAWKLVEDGHLNETDFSEFTAGNVTRMLTSMNPKFFSGTSVEGRVAVYPNTSTVGPDRDL